MTQSGFCTGEKRRLNYVDTIPMFGVHYGPMCDTAICQVCVFSVSGWWAVFFSKHLSNFKHQAHRELGSASLTCAIIKKFLKNQNKLKPRPENKQYSQGNKPRRDDILGQTDSDHEVCFHHSLFGSLLVCSFPCFFLF